MKFIIWGHKLHTHTHSYIHYGYYKAFQSLGYETYWLDNNDQFPNDISNALFLTEGQVDQKIPLFKEAKYILHHCDLKKYNDVGCKYINLCNYVEPCERGISMNYNGSCKKISEFLFLDEKNNAIYQPWATDLLPEEIDENNPIMYNPNLNEIAYIGTIQHDNILPKFQQFAQCAFSCNKSVKVYKNVGFEENKTLVNNSYISIDIRGDWHQKCGYIPCRIFKNLSYGKFTGTNSPHVGSILKDYVAYDNDPYNLYFVTEQSYAYMTKEKMKEIMLYIKNNHTYINRVENLLRFI